MVRVFWAGEWRKVVVDDRLPFDAASGRLFPGSEAPNELWPALMYKAWLQLTHACVPLPCLLLLWPCSCHNALVLGLSASIVP